jgi:hypothetical protein
VNTPLSLFFSLERGKNKKWNRFLYFENRKREKELESKAYYNQTID